MQKIKESRIHPYYDYSLDELSSGYTSVLALPGRPIQNREINSISGLIYGNLKKVTDIIIQDGTIISGCNFIKDKSDIDNIKCILEPGNIYFEGLVIAIDVGEKGKIWRYNIDPLLSEVPHGISILCVEVIKYAVSELDDPTLNDPAENYENYGVPGAHRLKFSAIPRIMSEIDFYKVSSVNKNLVSILKLFNGEISGPTKPKPIFGLVRDWIAKRTYDEVGNYIANGLAVKIKSSENIRNTNSEYVIHINPGKVYINGYEHFYNHKTIITSKSAIDKLSTNNIPEIHEYTASIDKYFLNNKNINVIENIVGEVEITSIPIRAKLNIDDIPEEFAPVSSVVRLYKKNNDNSVTVIPENLYYIDSNRKIIWTTPINMTTERPPLNTTYYIDIIKSDVFIPGRDYILDNNSIRFINPNKKPRSKRSFSVYYSWFVSRIDLLYIDENGVIQLINGIPNEENLIEEPKAPAGSLTLSSIYVIPSKVPEEYKIKNFHIMRMPISELKSMKSRLDNIEHGFAMSQLETVAHSKHTARESVATLKNIFVESFDNLTKSDIGHFLTDCSIDIFSSQLKLPIISSAIGIYDIIISDQFSNRVNYPYMLTSKSKNSISIDWQNFANYTLDLNPFNYVKLKPEINISPDCSIYYDSKYSYVKNVFVPTAIFYSHKAVLDWWRNKNDNFLNTTNNDNNMAANNQKILGLRELDPPYILPETIAINGLNFPPNEIIEIYVDDKKVFAFTFKEEFRLDIDRISATSGNLKTNGEGKFEGNFDLPDKLTSGSHLVTVKTLAGDFKAFSSFDGKIEFKPLKQFTMTSKQDQTTPAVYVRKYNATYNDPVAQSFKFNTDIFITDIDVYFQDKTPDSYVFFTIRDVENGLPGNSIIYEKNIHSDMINLSSRNTEIATKITFDYPIYLSSNKEYCFTLGADKTGYKVWYAKVDNTFDINTGKMIQSKTHPGTFFQGSGSGSWTALNDTSLAFTLYRADFDTRTTYYTNNIRSDIGNFSMFNISADFAKLDKTDIEIYYAINLDDNEIYEDTNWKYVPFDEYIKILNKTSYIVDGMKIRFKFVFSSQESHISPVINLNSLEIILGKYRPKGNYISKTITI